MQLKLLYSNNVRNSSSEIMIYSNIIVSTIHLNSSLFKHMIIIRYIAYKIHSIRMLQTPKYSVKNQD